MYKLQQNNDSFRRCRQLVIWDINHLQDVIARIELGAYVAFRMWGLRIQDFGVLRLGRLEGLVVCGLRLSPKPKTQNLKP